MCLFHLVLSQEIADGVSKSTQAVQAAEAGIRQIGAVARQQTICMLELQLFFLYLKRSSPPPPPTHTHILFLEPQISFSILFLVINIVPVSYIEDCYVCMIQQ